MRRLAVFDLDGTLVDSRHSIGEAMAQAFAALDLPPPSYDETRRIVGLSLVPALQILAPHLDPARWPELGVAYKNAFVRNRENGIREPLYDGARETLERMRAAGWLMGIATGKARRGIDHVLAAHDLSSFFDCGFCADDGPGKPDPHMLALNMQALDVDPEHTVMIGDTTFDMEMARAAGAYALGVSWGFHTADEIAAHAHEIAHDFPTLNAMLASWRAA
ncbi:similar to phosphoglycolate phosphatase [alpha proteobacterium U9-1i]|nr:similar to phosphoglycolate phosphatase [alpha proteobacterium U9-1i]